MRQLVIEPRDTLLFRDAREFSTGSAKSMSFPLPSVVAGAVRTRLALSKGVDLKDSGQVQALLQIPVKSPFLVDLGEVTKIQDWFFPAPADAVVFEKDLVEPLHPVAFPDGCKSDFERLSLLPLSLGRDIKTKPASNAARFWSYEGALRRWLINSESFNLSTGIQGPVSETRVHIKISPAGTAEDRFLFSTEMLRFSYCTADKKLSSSRRLGIAALVEDEVNLSGLYPIGGERRLGHWSTQPAANPACPDEIRKAVRQQKRARLLLVTPGYFQQDTWKPADLGGVELKAAALRGPLTASGWDLQAKKPKPSRRLAPAGTVYFVQLPDNWSTAEVDAWVDRYWFGTLSDDQQSQKDGFGVCLVGTWTREIQALPKGKTK